MTVNEVSDVENRVISNGVTDCFKNSMLLQANFFFKVAFYFKHIVLKIPFYSKQIVSEMSFYSKQIIWSREMDEMYKKYTGQLHLILVLHTF